MRWFVGSAVAILLIWGAYTASPYWALWDFATALADRDVPRALERVNFRAMRLSLAKQIVSEGIARKSDPEAGSSLETQMLASTVAVAADPLLEQIVTPQGMFRLLGELNPQTVQPRPGGRRLRLDAQALSNALATLRSSTWRGFRNVAFRLPPEPNGAPQVRVHFRLSRMTWRVVSIDLPPEARQELLDRLARRSGPPRSN